MSTRIDELGLDWYDLDYEPENAWRRLRSILNDKVLQFNPYLVDDKPLIDCAMRGYWREFPALTQMMIFTFTDIRKIKTPAYSYEAVYFKIGNSPKEYYIPMATFILGISYRANRLRERQMIGKQRVTNYSMVVEMIGKSYFVSHALKGRSQIGEKEGLAYHMSRLWGSQTNQAKIIRSAMTAAKIYILEEVMKYPFNLDYLACPRSLIDYKPEILQAIEKFRRYPMDL